MHCQYILQLSLLTLLSLPGTLAQTWSVWYRDRDRTTVICASKGSSVVLDCTYSHPAAQIVRRKIWFTPRGNTKLDGSQQGDGVYNTSGVIMPRYSGRTEFYDQDNNCTLKLNNVTEDDRGRFFFRFEANGPGQLHQGFTGSWGVDLTISDAPRDVSVKVSPSPEVVKGSRLTLTCSNNANPAAETYTWFQRSGPLLSLRLGTGKEHTFNEIDSDDSGLYFCMAQNALGSQNSTEQEVKVRESAHLIVVLAALGALFLVTAVIVVLYIYIKRRKWNTAEQKLPTKPVPQIQKATLSRPEDIYENMRQSAKPITDPDDMNYAELNISPAPSPRRQLNNKAEDDDAHVYSQLQTH
ncbi:B-cell receptor CD22 isoform X4 [Salmo salar]|uniref:B-cell receptor CD22 isoform X4 n=1 Tax=Salmo salar TaxID=8030 RepID=A0ABM3EU85_SALSA|nr:B-cell receptor CD22-like isoform X4 [Salmo salar]